MCGIAGILNLGKEPISPEVLKRMTDAISHRGPDDEGCYIDNFVGLGHRRLAIIDLSSAGHQPMIAHDNMSIITYNGEIYNFREIRSELEQKGYLFQSKSDTEVILHSYAEWGADCVLRFNGMFVFAIWDKRLKELFIARDRYGIKPVYYTFCNNSFIFASEQKALLQHPGVYRNIDLEALIEYFTFQNIFSDKTLLQNIKIFPAGCWVKLSPGNVEDRLRFVKYWDYRFEEPEQIVSEGELQEELDRLFRQSVMRQLVSDVDVGAYLSGGMDSGSLTAVAANSLPYIKTFTCGFDLHSASGLELGFDEREKAEYMSYLFKTEHYEMVLKAGDMERVMPRLTWHLEEPRVGQSYPNFYIAQLASKFVKVVLSGVGGDELFGGYPWRYNQAVGNDSFQQYIDKYYGFWQRLIPGREIQQVFGPVWNQVAHINTRDIFCQVFQGHNTTLNRSEDYINHSLYFEAKTFLHGLLVVEDKLSMAHGLESRVPFLDNDLVDFAMKVPISLKLKNLMQIVGVNENEIGPKSLEKTKNGKILLRQMMEKYIPRCITDSEKQGFSAPDASWFRGESIEYVQKLLYKKNAHIYDFLERSSVLKLLNEHMAGKCNRRLFIWSLLNLEHWCEQYLT
jgi:asparagine synthase (glutamine-hydrolysing)